ncbi:MAG: hypothetical protein JNL82_26100 [Myxococcales bacterium]|jgi:hypothetical protein|nr:hypothetical protein [Myxococcales bacterium]
MDVRPPQEWLYRATTAQEGLESTRKFAEEFGFIARTAFAEGEREQMVTLVNKVGYRDIIHLYYIDDSGGHVLGSYRVVGPNNHPQPKQFGAAVKGAPTLRVVAEGELLTALREVKGYAPDPRLGGFTGWPVVPGEKVSPGYGVDLFTGRNTLIAYPLPRRTRR